MSSVFKCPKCRKVYDVLDAPYAGAGADRKKRCGCGAVLIVKATARGYKVTINAALCEVADKKRPARRSLPALEKVHSTMLDLSLAVKTGEKMRVGGGSPDWRKGYAAGAEEAIRQCLGILIEVMSEEPEGND